MMNNNEPVVLVAEFVDPTYNRVVNRTGRIFTVTAPTPDTRRVVIEGENEHAGHSTFIELSNAVFPLDQYTSCIVPLIPGMKNFRLVQGNL